MFTYLIYFIWEDYDYGDFKKDYNDTWFLFSVEAIFNLMRRWIDFVISHPKLILFFIISISLFSLYFLPKVRIDNTVEALYLKKSANYKFFQKWKKQFGTDEYIIVAFRSKDLFSKKILSLIDNLTFQFKKLKYVRKVTSLTNVKDIKGAENYFIVERFIKKLPETNKEFKKLKEDAVSNPLYSKRIVSLDGDTTAIIIELEAREGDNLYKKITIKEIEKILKREERKGLKFYLSGPVVRDYYFAHYMQRDLKTFLPLVLLLIIFILILIFRNFIGIGLPLVTILFSLLWTMAFLYFYGASINNVTTILPPLIIALAVADSIHIISEYFGKISNEGGNKKDILKNTFEELFKPCFLTSFTTAVGFSSLAVSHVPAVRDFGIVAGVGIIFAFLITFSFLPAILILLPSFQKKHLTTHVYFFKKILIKIGKLNQNFNKQIILATLIIIFISFAGILKLKVGTNLLEYFKKKSPIYKSTIFVEKNLSGIHFLNISLKAKKKDIFKEPAVLKKVEKLQEFLEKIPETDKVISLVDYIKKMNQAFHDNSPKYYKIPNSRKVIAQYLFLYGINDLDHYVDFNYQWTTIRVRLNEHDSTQLSRIIEKIRIYLNENFSNGIDAKLTGHTILETDINETLLRDQIGSLLLAMIIIFGTLFFIFKSISVGFVSLIPNCIPIIINFGLMGFLGIRLNTATAMISAVAIGIIVDDTIHFLHAFGKNLKERGDYINSMYNSLLLKGRAIISTSIVLSLAFGILAFSSFVPTMDFGILSAIIMLTALLGDLVILPSLLLYFKPKFKN